MSKSLFSFLLTVTAALIAQLASAQNIQINFVDESQDGLTPAQSVITAAHQVGFFQAADNVFNQFTSNTYTGSDPNVQQIDLLGLGSSLVDSQGNATSAVIRYSEGLTNVDFSAGFVSGGDTQNEAAGNPGDSGAPGNGLYTGLFFTRPGEGGLALQIAGLNPSDYELYIYTKESNAVLRSFDHSVQLDNDDISSAADGSVKVIAEGNNNTAFVEDLNFTRHQFTVTGSENVAIFSSVNNSTEPNEPRDFASIAALQIVDLNTVDDPCDVNGMDGCTLADFEIIRSNFFGTGLDRIDGDLSSDGVVDFVDFRIWKAGFLEMGGSIEALEGLTLPVPEPSAALLGLIACSVGCVNTRRYRNRK